MKEIRGMKRGVKLDPQPTNAERLQQMDVELKNMQMAGRVNQMMIKQMLQNYQELTQDLSKAYGMINELQYKVLAMLRVAGADMKDLVDQKVDVLRLNDFMEASDAEDASKDFTVGDVVQEDSTVIITSHAGDGDGIFRSRIKLSECGVPALIEGFTGKSVGATVACQLNGADHLVELLGIRNPASKPSVADSTELGNDGGCWVRGAEMEDIMARGVNVMTGEIGPKVN